MTKKDIKIAVLGAFASIVFTAIYDIAKSKPILSTFWDFLKWAWNNVFEFKFSVWQILIGLVLLYLILYLLSLKNGKETQNQVLWTSYKEDNIQNMKWSWNWEKDFLTGKWQIEDLRPVCDSCGTKMHLKNSFNNWEPFAECPRCDKKFKGQKDLKKVEAVIIDNVQRGIYPNK